MSSFSSEQWRALGPYLDQAFEMDESQREVWLSSVAAENPTLAAQLRELLQDHAVLARAGFMEGNATHEVLPSHLAGHVLGPYTLASQIGQGGMGSVWLAERNDGRFEKKVAVKFINLALIGQANEERFRREGAILGRLAHPHIAQLIDAGVSTNGVAYLVLEYVEGEPIDKYCDEAKLDIGQRIRLFLQVTSAVAHAHSNLIVHRDLKPSNVLVSRSGEVKLLDFGIAKLVDESSEGSPTVLTKEGGRALTPEYAAPEQLTGDPITTATDVFNLGILLYLLLTGKHPVGEKQNTPASLVKAILEKEPQRLSAAVTAKADPETACGNAARRMTTPDRLQRLLGGDLETIVAKALKKDPEERYSSANALADDLRRYLNHEPIGARADSFGYRTTKFVRRNRVVVAMASLALVVAIAGVIGVVLQARKARQQRDFAFEQLRRSEDHDEFLNFVLYNAAPKGKMFTVDDLLTRAEQFVGKQQSSNATRRVDLWMWIASDYSSKDEFAKARVLAEKAYELTRAIPDQSVHARAACVLAEAMNGLGDTAKAEQFVEEGLRALPNGPEYDLDRVNCLDVGSSAMQRSDVSRAVEKMVTAKKIVEQSPLATDALRMRIAADLAAAYSAAGRNPESLAEFERAASFLPSLGYEDTVTASALFDDWALELDQIGRTREAADIDRRAIGILQDNDNLGTVSPMYLVNYAKMLSKLNRPDEARNFAQQAYDRAKDGHNQTVMGQSLLVLARIAISEKKIDHAVALLNELEPLMRKILPPGHYGFATLTTDRALIALEQGNVPLASDLSRQAVAIGEAARAKRKGGAFLLPTLLLNDSHIALAAGKPEQALADADQAISMEHSPEEQGTMSAKLGSAYLARARALDVLGRHDEARAVAKLAVDGLEQSLGGDNPDTQSARQLAGASEQAASSEKR